MVLLMVVLAGCTDAARSNLKAYGDKHSITLYSGGKVVGQWISTGKVISESQSDGWCFEDEATHKLFRISGTVVVTNYIPKPEESAN